MGAFAFAFLSTPYVQADYYTNGPLVPFARASTDFTCDADSAREYEYRNTPKGTRVSATLCFQASSYPGGKMLVSYKVGPDLTLYGNGNFAPDVTAYTSQRASEFQLPEADLADFDKQGWNARVENFKAALYASVIGVVVLSLLALIVGWIVRGFAGIPMRQDSRPGQP